MYFAFKRNDPILQGLTKAQLCFFGEQQLPAIIQQFYQQLKKIFLIIAVILLAIAVHKSTALFFGGTAITCNYSAILSAIIKNNFL